MRQMERNISLVLHTTSKKELGSSKKLKNSQFFSSVSQKTDIGDIATYQIRSEVRKACRVNQNDSPAHKDLMESNIKIQPVSCLYTDHLYKSNLHAYAQSIAVAKYRRKYLFEKNEREKLAEINQKLSETVSEKQKEIDILKFAYKTLEIEKQKAEIRKTKKNKKEKEKEKEKAEMTAIRQVGEQQTVFRLQPKEGFEDKQLRLWKDEARTSYNNTNLNMLKNFLSPLSPIVCDTLKQCYGIQVTGPLEQGGLFEQSFSDQSDWPEGTQKSSKQQQEKARVVDMLRRLSSKYDVNGQFQKQVVGILSENFHLVVSHPNSGEHKAEQKQQENQLADKYNKEVGKFLDKIVHERKKIETEIKGQYLREKDQLQQQIAELKTKVSVQEQFLNCKMLEIEQYITKLWLKDEQLQKKQLEIKELKRLIQRVEKKNYMFLQKEEQQRQQAEALQRFSQNLKINDDKIKNFLAESLHVSPSQHNGSMLPNYQQNLSYLAYLFKNKETLYYEHMKMNAVRLREYECLLQIMEKKMYDVDRFHAKLTDCLAIGEVAEKKIILMLRAYFRVGNKF